MRKIAVPLLIAIQGFALSGCGSNSSTADSVARNCGDPATKTLASNQLADWLNQNVGKGNAYGMHGTFVAEMSASVPMGALRGTQQCLANTSIGIRETSGAVLIGQQILGLHFLLTAGQVTLDEGDLLSDAARAADSLLVRMAMQPTQPESRAISAPSPLESYTFVTCFKHEADARRSAGPGGWHPGDAPCIEMLPAIHETKLGCLAKLADFAKHEESTEDFDASVGRVYLRGQTHDRWMQCYDTGK